MLALVSNAAHNNPHLLYEQTLAYNRMLGDDCVHVINVNFRDSRGFFGRAGRLGIDFSTIGNVVFAEPERVVYPPSTLGIHALNYAFASRRGIRADYVILHTSSDLPFRTGLASHMRNFDIGQAPASPGKSQEWHSHKFAAADPVLVSFVERMIGPRPDENVRIPRARFEGSFYRWELMAEIFFRLSVEFGFDAEHHWTKPYPIEEIVLPIMADHFSRTLNLRRTRHFVRVASSSDKERFPDLDRRTPPSEHDTDALTSLENDIFSFKFAPPSDSPLRDWVFSQLGLDIDLRIRAKSEPV